MRYFFDQFSSIQMTKAEFTAFSVRWQKIVERALSEVTKQPITIWASEADRVRLLNLLVWRTRHKVSLQFIFKAILPFWRNLKFAKRSSGLGVRIPSLTGKKSYSLLTQAIEEEYPHGENWEAWKSEQQQRFATKAIFRIEDVTTLTQSYKEYIAKSKKRFEKRKAEIARKKYRGNPFV